MVDVAVWLGPGLPPPGARLRYALGLSVGLHLRAVRSTIGRGSIIEALTAAGFRLTGTFPHSINFRHPSGEPVQIIVDPEFDPIDRAEGLDLGAVRIRAP